MEVGLACGPCRRKGPVTDGFEDVTGLPGPGLRGLKVRKSGRSPSVCKRAASQADRVRGAGPPCRPLPSEGRLGKGRGAYRLTVDRDETVTEDQNALVDGADYKPR